MCVFVCMPMFLGMKFGVRRLRAQSMDLESLRAYLLYLLVLS